MSSTTNTTSATSALRDGAAAAAAGVGQDVAVRRHRQGHHHQLQLSSAGGDVALQLMANEIARLRRENLQLKSRLTACACSNEDEEERAKDRKRARNWYAGVPLPFSKPGPYATTSVMMNWDSGLREARIRMPFLHQYEFGPDKPFILGDWHSVQNPVMVAEKLPNHQAIFTYVNETFVNLFQLSPVVGRPTSSVLAVRPGKVHPSKLHWEPWHVSDILAETKLLRGGDGRLWRVTVNLQLFYDHRGNLKHFVCLLQHWEAGQLLPDEIFPSDSLAPSLDTSPDTSLSPPRPPSPSSSPAFSWDQLLGPPTSLPDELYAELQRELLSE